eukprot:TRINITY_DN6768_c0_g1_i6.p1 TRINITY_DN6768_c0_g1~~TRINITY_DN6768_c0_g1_i6.p1  ORF type:complete len:564 (+),score=109.02 TRINITY_DN6768_c0_g1_i6:1526-3217(+)
MSPVEYAAAENDSEVLGMLIGAVPRAKAAKFEALRDSLADALEAVPDFSVEISFNCESRFIPFVRSFTPSDVYKVYKKKDKVRVDLTLLGLMGRKGIRGNMSIVFKGRGGPLLLVNHDTKTSETVFSDLSDKNIEAIVTELLSEKKNVLKSQQMSLHHLLYNNKPITKMIEGFACSKFEAKHKLTYMKNRPTSFKQYDSFESYFHDLTLHPDSDCDGSRTTETEYKAIAWLSNRYPLKYSQFAPLIHIMSYASEHFANLVGLLPECHLEREGFPLKLSIPLYYTLSVNIALKNLLYTPIIDGEFMSIDERCGTPSEQTNETKVKLYSPISHGILRSCQSFVQVDNEHYPSFVDDNDRLRWTSYESDEGKDSVYWTQEKFENLLKDDSSSEAKAVVQIVRNNRGDDSYDLDAIEDETEQTSSNTVNEKIKTHSILKIKTLNAIFMDKSEKYLCEIKKRREENLKKIMNPRKIKGKGSWDGTKVVKLPLNGVKLKNVAEKLQEEAKARKSTLVKESMWESEGINGLRLKMNNARAIRNSTSLKCSGKKLKVYKKTADIDVALNPM